MAKVSILDRSKTVNTYCQIPEPFWSGSIHMSLNILNFLWRDSYGLICLFICRPQRAAPLKKPWSTPTLYELSATSDKGYESCEDSS